jgi:YNFM family putative membrane transporter
LQTYRDSPLSAICPVTSSAPIERATPAFRQTALALFAAGFSTFALMYCVQPLLPELASAFNVSATVSSLAISLTTGTLSITLLVSGVVTERVPRKTLIVMSLGATGLLTIFCVAARSWTGFLVMRGLAGIAFAGLPAIAMAYIAEEMARPAAGLAMGIYVAGTAVGGMSGRLLTAALTDTFGWRTAVGMTGVFGLCTAVLVALLLPRATRIRQPSGSLRELARTYRRHLSDGQFRKMLAEGALFMGAFVAIYNFLTFRLMAPPYALGNTAIGSVFLLYLLGMVSSPWAGMVAETRGRRNTLALSLSFMLAGAGLTVFAWLPLVMIGISLLTFGFFAAHAVTSSWIGMRARGQAAQAASLYIVFYYLGASVTGTIAGVFWTRLGWMGVAGFVGLMLIAALALLPDSQPEDGRTADVALPTIT